MLKNKRQKRARVLTLFFDKNGPEKLIFKILHCFIYELTHHYIRIKLKPYKH